MNKKGFTLIELLGVIIILTVIFTLTFPAVNNIIDSGRDTVYQKQINTILDGAYDWSLKNSKYLPEYHDSIYITLSDLRRLGLVENNILNPNENKSFPDYLVIEIKNVGANYSDNDKYSKSAGDYLYSINEGTISNNAYLNRKPEIVLSGLTYNSDGTYTTEINVGSSYSFPSYTATSYKDLDITNNVSLTIDYKGKYTNEIDTFKAGIYHINYTVVDEEGYSATAVNNVIITDNVPPVINLPANNTLALSVYTFDALEGVTCTDNSNSCNIESQGIVTLGVAGKYVILYIAKDPSGNTSTARRVITIQ